MPTPSAARDRRDPLIALALFALAAMLFLINIAQPPEIAFDEFWYVPAARDLVHLDRDSNLEHPLFAKQIIALGIILFGDNAFGWRVFGALLGAAIPACAYVLLRYLALDRPLAIFAAALMMIDQTLFVMARTAMLDVHALGLLALSTMILTWSAQPGRGRVQALAGIAGAGMLYGLACGAKWLAIFEGGVLWLGLLIVMLSRRSGGPRPLWPGLHPVAVLALFGGITIIVYFLTFWPLLLLKHGRTDLAGVFSTQLRIFHRSSMPLAHHPHQSPWWTWPVLIEPIWFYLSKPVEGMRRGVFYVGNPIIYWLGALAAAGCLIAGAQRRDRAMLGIGGGWLMAWLIWAIVPKKIGFLYYYAPASLLLAPAIAIFAQRVVSRGFRVILLASIAGLALASFLYFYPILSAGLIRENEWRRFVLLPSWG